jgi:hypothetical protein
MVLMNTTISLFSSPIYGDDGGVEFGVPKCSTPETVLLRRYLAARDCVFSLLRRGCTSFIVQTCPPNAGVAKFLNPDAKSTNAFLSLLSQVQLHPFPAQEAASQEARAVVALPPALTFVRFNASPREVLRRRGPRRRG